MRYFIPILIACASWASSCNKTSFITGSEALLSVSRDSIYFDTLFTSTGSVTQLFKIFNENDRKLRVGVNVNGGADSYFKINADGVPGPAINELEMEPNDSIYVFVSVSIDPGSEDLPFIVEDSLTIRYNGNTKQVKLSAWGQDAHFLNTTLLSTNTLWTNDKPYVITGGLLVPEDVTLSIQRGTRVYLHADAPIIIEGTMIAKGETNDSMRIVFQGDRLDEPYKYYPGAWPGIYSGETSHGNVLESVIIKNAYQGIVTVGSQMPGDPTLTLDGCIIDNCYDAGIIGSATSIHAVNCVISNCGKNIVLVNGGDYTFTHCTDVAISNSLIQHKQPVLSVANFRADGSMVYTAELRANFRNCIFWGENGIVDNEVMVVKEGADLFDVSFTNCLWKNSIEPENISSSGIISNQDPLFTTIDTRNNIYDFRPMEGSPLLNAGTNAGTAADIDGNARDINNPDVGAFESTF